MKKKFLIIIFLCLSSVNQLFAQSFHVDFLFNPGTTFGTDYLFPSAINDSTDFQLIKYKLQFVKPLKTKFGVDLKNFDFKKMDAKANQVFLTSKLNVSQPALSDNNYFENIYKGEIGIMAITASIRNGIWIYSANIYAEENGTTLKESFTPNFRGYIANINIKNLKFIYFYGVGLAINQGKFYPVPVFGFRTKIAPKLRAELIVPVHVKLNYEISNKVNLDLASYFSGINAIYREGSAFQGNDNTLNLRQLKIYLGLNAKLGKHYKLKTEVGYAGLQKIDALSSDYNQKVQAAPYLSISFNYHFGKSVFANFINREE